MAKITYSNKSTGSQFSSSEVNQIKSVVNTNEQEMLSIDSRLINTESSVLTLETDRTDWDTAVDVINNTQDNWNEAYSTVSITSGDWENTHTSVSQTSANWNLAYSTVISLSTDWAIDVDTQLDITTTDLYSTVNTNSASWGVDTNTGVNLTQIDQSYLPGEKWTPISDTGVISWYDAADTNTITTDADNVVLSIDSKGSDSTSLVIDENFDINMTGNVESGVDTINNNNVITVTEDSFLRSDGTGAPLPDDYVMYVVADIDTVTSSADSLISVKSPGGTSNWQFGAGSATEFRGVLNLSDVGSQGSLSLGTTDRSGTPGVFKLLFSLTQNKIEISYNGGVTTVGEVGQYTQFNSGGSEILYLFVNRGESSGLSGKIAEVIVSSSVDTDTTEKIEGYLSDKWNLSILATHTYAETLRTTTNPVKFDNHISWPDGGSVDANDISTVVKGNSAGWSASDGLGFWEENTSGNLLPVANASYDIGSAEQKVRHLYLSDNSLKFVNEDNEVSATLSSSLLNSFTNIETTKAQPPTAVESGEVGEIRYQQGWSHIYICFAPNTWIRLPVEIGSMGGW